MYVRTKMKFLGQNYQMLEPEQDRLTSRLDRQTRLNVAWRRIRGWTMSLGLVPVDEELLFLLSGNTVMPKPIHMIRRANRLS